MIPELPEPVSENVIYPLRRLFKEVVQNASVIEKGICTWTENFEGKRILSSVEQLMFSTSDETREGFINVFDRAQIPLDNRPVSVRVV